MSGAFRRREAPAENEFALRGEAPARSLERRAWLRSTALPELTRVLRYLTDDDEVRVVPTLKNGRPAHVLTREERARGGRARAAKARERRASLRNDPRSSARLVEAAQRLGEMLRSENLRTAMWADNVVSLWRS